MKLFTSCKISIENGLSIHQDFQMDMLLKRPRSSMNSDKNTFHKNSDTQHFVDSIILLIILESIASLILLSELIIKHKIMDKVINLVHLNNTFRKNNPLKEETVIEDKVYNRLYSNQ